MSADDIGHDVLLVTALVGDSEEPIEALGWVSATTNHYGPETYLPPGVAGTVVVDGQEVVVAAADKGHRYPDAQPREMTLEEKRAYCRRLVEDNVERASGVPAVASNPGAGPGSPEAGSDYVRAMLRLRQAIDAFWPRHGRPTRQGSTVDYFCRMLLLVAHRVAPAALAGPQQHFEAFLRERGALLEHGPTAADQDLFAAWQRHTDETHADQLAFVTFADMALDASAAFECERNDVPVSGLRPEYWKAWMQWLDGEPDGALRAAARRLDVTVRLARNRFVAHVDPERLHGGSSRSDGTWTLMAFATDPEEAGSRIQQLYVRLRRPVRSVRDGEGLARDLLDAAPSMGKDDRRCAHEALEFASVYVDPVVLMDEISGLLEQIVADARATTPRRDLGIVGTSAGGAGDATGHSGAPDP